MERAASAMRRRWMSLLVLVAIFGFSGSANAALTTIGTATYMGIEHNLIYEDNSINGGLVWLDYTAGKNTWSNQVSWAASLNGSGVLSYSLNPGIGITWADQWRLPATYDGTTTQGYNITSSEMGNLYYAALGNLGYEDTSGHTQSGWGLVNRGPFNELQAVAYWSGTEYSAYKFNAYYFKFLDGAQVNASKGATLYALAVRPGEVSAVPVPGTLLLLASGLVGLAGFRRRLTKS